MTEQIPEGAGEPAEVDISFYPDELGLKVVAILGEASITVEHSWDGPQEAAILVQALPNILIAVQEALDKQEEA